MIKNDIALAIEKKSEFNRAKSLLIVESILKALKQGLEKNQKIEVRGFGSFKVKTRDPREGRNPKTGQSVSIPAKRVPFFKAGKELRELVNG